MDILIYGAGFSGLLLADNLTKKGHTVTVAERDSKLKAICGCGIPTDSFVEIATKHGLNAEKYILWKSKRLVIDYRGHKIRLPMRGLCTFDKYSFMQDLNAHIVFNVNYGRGRSVPHGYDFVVDATGTRALLGALPSDKTYVCYQVKAHFDKLPVEDFYMRFKHGVADGKYLWLFPLGENEAYVGCGSLNGVQAAAEVAAFVEKHQGVILEKMGRQLRVNLPSQSMPFFKVNGSTVIVGVGNSVGAISSFGEGNELASITADLLAKNLSYNGLPTYQYEVVKRLNWLNNDYAFYDKINNGNYLSMFYRLAKVQRTFRKRLHVSMNPLSFF